MEPPIDRIKLSQSARDQLIKLKRITKIDQWNVLCRWAFWPLAGRTDAAFTCAYSLPTATLK